MNPADLVERLREDANGLRQAVSQASFASDTYVRVKQPDLLIAVLNEAAAEIERLRKAHQYTLDEYEAYCGHAKAEIERLRQTLQYTVHEYEHAKAENERLKEKTHEPG